MLPLVVRGRPRLSTSQEICPPPSCVDASLVRCSLHVERMKDMLSVCAANGARLVRALVLLPW